MRSYILDITSIDPGWSRGEPIPDVRVLDALATKGITASYTAVDPIAGTVTVQADGDPAAALAGVTIGPTPAEAARSTALANYRAAVLALRGATTTAGVADAVKQWERATTAVLKLIVRELEDA